MCKILRKTVIPVLRVLMPFFSVMTFWLGTELISPETSVPQLILCIGLVAYAMALPMLVLRYWCDVEQTLLIGDALISHQTYGSERLSLRTNLWALASGVLCAVVLRAVNLGREGFYYLVLPLAVVLGALHLAIGGCMAVSLWRMWRYDGLISVCRCAGYDPATGQPRLVYEGWTVADVRRELHVGDNGYALTMEEERDRFLKEYYRKHPEA